MPRPATWPNGSPRSWTRTSASRAQLQEARVQAALGGGDGDADEESVQVAGITLVARQVDGVDKDALRALVDRHRDQIKSGVVVLAGSADGKVLVVVGVTPDLIKKVPAGKIVKQLAPIVGGGGGGRPDFAEAGGKDASKIGELLAASRTVVATSREASPGSGSQPPSSADSRRRPLATPVHACAGAARGSTT